VILVSIIGTRTDDEIAVYGCSRKTSGRDGGFEVKIYAGERSCELGLGRGAKIGWGRGSEE